MGKGSKFETGDRFCQTRGQKDRNQYGYPSEVVGEIEGVLGGEEKIRQEVTNLSGYFRFPWVDIPPGESCWIAPPALNALAALLSLKIFIFSA